MNALFALVVGFVMYPVDIMIQALANRDFTAQMDRKVPKKLYARLADTAHKEAQSRDFALVERSVIIHSCGKRTNALIALLGHIVWRMVWPPQVALVVRDIIVQLVPRLKML